MVPFLFQPFFFLGGSDLVDLYSFLGKFWVGIFPQFGVSTSLFSGSFGCIG